MHEKLTPEQQREILEAGIRVFADFGYEKARMQDIAAEAKLSVGVLYKYYVCKETLFDACLEHGLTALERFLSELSQSEHKPLDYGRMLIRSVAEHASRFSDTVRLYHEITCTRDHVRAKALADRIESMTGRLYGEIIARAQAAGDVRSDLDPKLFALFLDNLLMMMQFTYCTPYYRERYRLFVGGDIAADGDRVADQLLKFLESAFALEQKDIQHRGDAARIPSILAERPKEGVISHAKDPFDCLRHRNDRCQNLPVRGDGCHSPRCQCQSGLSAVCAGQRRR